MLFIKVIVYLFGLWTNRFSVGATIQLTRFTVTTDVRRPHQLSGTTKTSVSQFQCTSTCDLNDECLSVNYEPLTGSCEQSGLPPIGQSPNSTPGWRIIKKKRYIFENSDPIDLTGAIAWQSTTVYGDVASGAIDGNPVYTYMDSGSCIHTATHYFGFWAVELAEATLIDGVIVFFRTDCCLFRTSKHRYRVSNDGVWTEVAYYEGPPTMRSENPLRIEFQNGTFGNVIKIDQETTHAMQLCEVIPMKPRL